VRSYSEAIESLHQAVARRGIHYSLDSLSAPLATLGNPHRALPPVIHVAGTNGKGSTTTLIASALQACGLRVGTFTSPHLLSYCERIAINGMPISEDDFCRYLQLAMAASPADISSEFELLTLMAFRYFANTLPDILVIETGLGGRLDSTNVVQPALTVITPIGLDHQDILGADLRRIATEKAGIIKLGIPVISAQQPPAVSDVIDAIAAPLNSPVTYVTPWPSIPQGFRLKADYQRQNAAVAEAAVTTILSQMDQSKSGIAQGLSDAFIWGRFTQYRLGTTTVTIDGAHNPHGLAALFTTLPKPRTLWMGMLRTKALADSLATLPRSIHTLSVYCPDPNRWYTPDEYQELTQIPVTEHSTTASLPEWDGDSLITGSLYFIATLRPLFATLTPL
jgi:dihydrofolate synthase / folylpolyglutamate synthase